jgi:competence protein ComEC
MTGHAEQLWAREDTERLQLRRAPLLAAAYWFALGIALARNWQPASLLAIAALLLTGPAIAALRLSLHIVVLPVAALWIAVEAALVSPGKLAMTAIDVGQGDSLLMISPDGHTMLVDAGGPVGGVTETAAATSAFDVGEEVVSPYLWSRRIRRLDTIALSHAHSDHMEE